MPAVSGSNQGTAVILTTSQDEFKAVYAHGEHWQGKECNNTLYEQGIFSAEAWTWHVIIAQISGPGNARATIEVERANTCFHPDVVFFVSREAIFD